MFTNCNSHFFHLTINIKTCWLTWITSLALEYSDFLSNNFLQIQLSFLSLFSGEGALNRIYIYLFICLLIEFSILSRLRSKRFYDYWLMSCFLKDLLLLDLIGAWICWAHVEWRYLLLLLRVHDFCSPYDNKLYWLFFMAIDYCILSYGSRVRLTACIKHIMLKYYFIFFLC